MAEESWFHLQQAIQEIKSIAPANSNIILVDDASWGIGDNLEGRRITPFLEEDGLTWDHQKMIQKRFWN